MTGPLRKQRRRRLRALGLRYGTPLLLGVGALALVQRGQLGRGAETRAGDTHGAAETKVTDAVDDVVSDPSGPTIGLPAPPGPGGESDPESRDVPPLAPTMTVGANRFPSPPAPLVPKPAAVRGIYLNAWAAGSPKRRAELLALAAWSEINTFVIDVKEMGEISYHSGVGVARAIGAGRSYIPDPRRVLAELRAAGVYPIARIVVFKDPVLAEKRPDWAIQTRDGGLWEDDRGVKWVDPYNREVWDYNIALAREAVLLGFSEIQWDYVRFPDVPARYLKDAVFPARNGRSMGQAIREFLRYSREELADLGVPITADVFGLTVSVGNDLGIGQRWEDLADVTDALLPMVYPSHFARGSYGIPIPNADPYRTVRTALEFAVRRSARIEGAAVIRPWLQDFSLGWPTYGAAEVRAQIQATYDVGLSEWILWNPASRYTSAALAPKVGPPPKLPLPSHIAPTDPESVRIRIPTPRLLGEPVRARTPRPDTSGGDHGSGPVG